MYPSSSIKDWNRSYLNFHKTYSYNTWQTGELSLGTTSSKVTWPCNHVATWSHVNNKKPCISTFMRPVTAKLDKVESYSKGPSFVKSLDISSTWSSDHMNDKKRYISTSARPMATKLERVVGSSAGLLSTKSYNLMIMWSNKVI